MGARGSDAAVGAVTSVPRTEGSRALTVLQLLHGALQVADARLVLLVPVPLGFVHEHRVMLGKLALQVVDTPSIQPFRLGQNLVAHRAPRARQRAFAGPTRRPWSPERA